MTEQYYKKYYKKFGMDGFVMDKVEVIPLIGPIKGWLCEKPEGFLGWVDNKDLIKFIEKVVFKRKYRFIDEPFEVFENG